MPPLVRCCCAVLSALLGAVLAAGCDYPEQGFFVLSGLDSRGEKVASHIFEVEELVDDTDLTYGFTIHLFDPATRTAYDLPFENAPEFDRRGWLFSLADSDYGQGDLALDLTHDDRMSFVGAWRARRSGQAWPLAGSVSPPEDGRSRVEFSLPVPPGGDIAGWQVEPLTVQQAEARLGKLSAYKHVAATAPGALDPALGRHALEAQRTAATPGSAGAAEEKPRYTPPPLGGRGGP